MFTGIVRAIGTVRDLSPSRGETRFEIATPLDISATPMGASISCSGCCLTVIEKGPDWFAVEVSAETLSKTTLGYWQAGAKINLEPSLKMGDELGGHIVTGHVDGLAEVVDILPDGGSHRFRFRVPDEFAAFIAPKGSVALDGVSLTVNEVQGSIFGVNIIPHTWDHTIFSTLRPGNRLNLEIDPLARYLRRMLDTQAGTRHVAAA